MLSPASKTRLKTYFISKQSPVHGDLFLLNEIQKALSIVEEVKKELVEKMDTIKAISKGDKGDSIVGPQGKRGDKGESGKNGKDGHTPIAGIDFSFPKDGKDGESIVGPAGKDGKDGSPDMAEDIRNKLELLDGDERLKIEAIKDLSDILDELKKRPRAVFGGGGLNKSALDAHFVDNETLTGTLDGANAIFTINNTPSPQTSLKIYRGGALQKLTDDYTISGTTITFLVAPQIGEVLICDYRI